MAEQNPSPPLYRADSRLSEVAPPRAVADGWRGRLSQAIHDAGANAEKALSYYAGPHATQAIQKLSQLASMFSPAADVIDAKENYQGAIESAQAGDVPGAIANTGYGLLSNIGLSELSAPVKAIVPIAAAKLAPTPTKIPEDEMFRRAVERSPSAAIEDDGVRISVMRGQRPEQSGEVSVRGGVFYLPEGSKDAKYYTGTGHNFAYGGQEKIKGETLFKNPLAVKGATGGKAPEAAFDQLLGKGAYKAMRDDATNSMPPYYLEDEGLREELVTRFLEKYAPEMVGNAYDILRNSQKGNQLAYALQEAAVASAVRRAGYDGVVGYSVGRKDKEPFLSEVFDVRETHYPTPNGEYEVWPEFRPKTNRDVLNKIQEMRAGK